MNLAGPWQRLHPLQYGAIHFDTSSQYRFNPTDGAYGVLYCGENLECCLLETVPRLDTPQHTTFRSLSRRVDLAPRALSEIATHHPLRLVDLSGDGLALIGAHAGLCSCPYDQVRPWSRALWAHPDQPDGLLFRARHNPRLASVALFDRAADDLFVRTTVPLLALPTRELAEIVNRYRISLRP
ncbi:MAG TPA: RES family NAD+ phosphorylase [Chloroflexota bacterium]|nr:RES family NAD+ phosphorylase [Chloroflexota bacterium]